MKKFISIVMIITMAMSFAACGNKFEETKPEIASKVVYESTTKAKQSCIDIIPEPEKTMGNYIKITMKTSDEEGCFYRVENAEQSDFESFVSGSKDVGFNNIDAEGTISGGYTFVAHDENKEHNLMVIYDSNNKTITITCEDAK